MNKITIPKIARSSKWVQKKVLTSAYLLMLISAVASSFARLILKILLIVRQGNQGGQNLEKIELIFSMKFGISPSYQHLFCKFES